MNDLSNLIRRLLSSEFQKFKTVTKTNTKDSFFYASIENDIIYIKLDKKPQDIDQKPMKIKMKDILDNYETMVDYLQCQFYSH